VGLYGPLSPYSTESGILFPYP